MILWESEVRSRSSAGFVFARVSWDFSIAQSNNYCNSCRCLEKTIEVQSLQLIARPTACRSIALQREHFATFEVQHLVYRLKIGRVLSLYRKLQFQPVLTQNFWGCFTRTSLAIHFCLENRCVMLTGWSAFDWTERAGSFQLESFKPLLPSGFLQIQKVLGKFRKLHDPGKLIGSNWKKLNEPTEINRNSKKNHQNVLKRFDLTDECIRMYLERLFRHWDRFCNLLVTFIRTASRKSSTDFV